MAIATEALRPSSTIADTSALDGAAFSHISTLSSVWSDDDDATYARDASGNAAIGAVHLDNPSASVAPAFIVPTVTLRARLRKGASAPNTCIVRLLASATAYTDNYTDPAYLAQISTNGTTSFATYSVAYTYAAVPTLTELNALVGYVQSGAGAGANQQYDIADLWVDITYEAAPVPGARQA